MTLAVARSATKRFGRVAAVHRVDISVAAGEVVGLLGANGAGKTTLMRLLLGLTAVTEGSIELFGQSPSRATRRRTGYVSQGLGLYEDLTTAENLSFAAAAFGARAIMPDDLRATGRMLVRDLPLGLKRRVAFAAALQHSPDLLVLDEPTSGVDALGTTALWDTIRSAGAGAGVLVSTHHMDEATECDRLVMMAAGRIIAAGALDDIIGDTRTVVVRAASWPDAFDALESAGLTVALVGETLRVPGAEPAEVVNALHSRGLEGRVEDARGTLDEIFAALVAEAA
jgi:ABC-2 type transport system ATP-binding protein